MSLDDAARRYFLKRAGSGVVAVAAAGGGAMQSTTSSESGPHGEYDIRAFGAKGDGKTLDTAAINQAIETAAAAGGGTVRFPAGTYLCYSIHLRSNITLYLGPGATILAADPPVPENDLLPTPAGNLMSPSPRLRPLPQISPGPVIVRLAISSPHIKLLCQWLWPKS